MFAVIMFVLAFGVGGKSMTDKHQRCREINFKNEFCEFNKKLESYKDFSLHRGK